jgi:signal transduction histidine kinase
MRQKIQSFFKKHLYISCTIQMLFLLICFPIHAEQTKHVLFIGSYSLSFPHTIPELKGIQEELNDNSHVLVNTEFMDAKNFTDKDNVYSFKSRLIFKLKKSPKYDAVIVSDDDAFNFVLDNQKSLFKDIPIFFMGVNNERKALQQNSNPWVTGIIEKLSIKETIDLMIKLFPHSSMVYAICDNTLFGEEGKHLFEACQIYYKNVHLKVISSNEYTYPEFFKKLETIPNICPVLFLTAYKDKNGATISFDEAIHEISTHLQSPMFYVLRVGIGKGVIGGKMLNFYKQGRLIGRMVKDVLNNKKNISDFKVLSSGPNEYAFDYNQLKRHHVNPSILPAGSIVYNQPVSVFKAHRELFIFISIVFAILVIYSIILTVSFNKRRKIAEELIRKNRKLLQTQKELTVAKEKAEEGDRIKSEFIHNLSHELKTPLNGIMGFTELLTNDPERKEENEQFKEIILNCSKQLYRIVSDILEISRLETKQVHVIEEKTNLNALLKDLYMIFGETAKKKNLAFSLTTDLPDEGCLIVIDSSKLNKIISNLLENAFKYTEKGHIFFGYHIYEKEIVFYVEDTGVGIPSGKQQIIFKRFSQADQRLSRKFDGLGLGLSIANENANLLKGKITLQSEYGKGTTFFVHLPYKKV